MSSSEINKINQKLITAVVAEKIRNAINKNELLPGQRIGEQEISELLNVSRTPVREAFRTLEAEGYLTHNPRCGVIVTVLNRNDIINIFDIRSHLEQLMVEKTALHISEDELAKLNAIGERMKAVSNDELDEETFRLLDEEIHDVLAANCGNSKLEELTKNLKNSTKLVRSRAGFSVSRAVESLSESIQLIQAINRKDCEAASKLMKIHFDKSLEFFLSSL